MSSSKQSESIYEQNFHPYRQAALGVGLTIFLLFLGMIMSGMNLTLPERFAWMCAGATLMMFAVFNSIFSLSAKNGMEYWGQSMTSYLALLVVNSLIAWGVSGETVYEAGSFSWIFVVTSVCYLVFISMMNIMKKIVGFAMKEEWSQPRLRSRNRKKRK